MNRNILVCLAWAVVMAGCSVNPVTGERDFMIVSEAQELQMGAQAYAPTQQSQGGAYDVDPGLTRYVQGVGSRLATVSDRELPYEFVVLNNSVPNAWALPGGKIAINRGLLTELNSEAELAAVLGHEIVHAAARHSAQQVSRGMLSQVLVVATAVATSDSDYGNLAVGGASIGAQLINSKYGREAELESDRYGMQYMSRAGYDPEGAVALQETFVRLSEGRRSDWLSGLFASHPPSPERVAANRATAQTLADGGKLGTDEFRLAMQRTLDLKPAYKVYDDGRKALADGKQSEALALANEALGLFSEEGHFHALRGDVRLVEKKYESAVTNYTRAIDRRPDFFYYYRQRGLARKELGQIAAAEVDLERSNELMPTAPAYYALGQIAESRGDLQNALARYKAVAKAGGDYGTAASRAVVRLELPSSPGTYIARRCDADAEGNLVVSVQNQSSVTVTNVRIVVRYADASGRPRQVVRGIGGQIQSGGIASVNTGFGPFVGGACPAEVVSAQIAD